MIIKKALYGLKSSGAAWRALFTTTLVDLGYTSTKADPDVWIRAQVKPDGFEYSELVLVYVNDIMVLYNSVLVQTHIPGSSLRKLILIPT
jgi:hypothetical protein